MTGQSEGMRPAGRGGAGGTLLGTGLGAIGGLGLPSQMPPFSPASQAAQETGNGLKQPSELLRIAGGSAQWLRRAQHPRAETVQAVGLPFERLLTCPPPATHP